MLLGRYGSDGRFRVPEVYAANDCGRAIHPGQVETQVEEAVIDALGPTLRAKMTLNQRATMQSNFTDYELVRVG